MRLASFHEALVRIIVWRSFENIGILILDRVSSALGDFPPGFSGVLVEYQANFNVVACFGWGVTRRWGLSGLGRWGVGVGWPWGWFWCRTNVTILFRVTGIPTVWLRQRTAIAIDGVDDTQAIVGARIDLVVARVK